MSEVNGYSRIIALGHILNLRRPWKEVVKVNKYSVISIYYTNFAQPGQILDMSMIIRKRNTLSIKCPWCNIENNCPYADRHIEWSVLLVADPRK